MRVFKFTSGTDIYGFSGNDEQEAQTELLDYIGDMDIHKVEEIPESEWDKPFIEMHEDNDTESEPFYTSIREQLEETPSLLFTNDQAIID
jgi:hypothetical protein